MLSQIQFWIQFVLVTAPFFVDQVICLPRPEQDNASRTCEVDTSYKLFRQLYPFTNRFALYPMSKAGREFFPEPAAPICPEGTPVNVYTDVSNRIGTCPWDYIYNYNENRIPQVINEARCLCENGCLDPDDRTIRRLDMRCQEIMHPMKVWRLDGCINGSYQNYEMYTEYVAVGCQCVKII